MSLNSLNRQLRPLSTAELLDRAFWFYRRHFWTLTGIVALIHLPLAIIQIVSLVTGFRTLNIFLTITFQGFSIPHVSFWLFTFGNFINAALIRAISSRYLGNSPTSIIASYRINIRRYAIFIAASCVPIAIECGRVSFENFRMFFNGVVFCWGVLQIPYLLLLFLYAHVLFVPQVSLLEDQGIYGTLQRSWRLVRSSPRRTFGILIAAHLLGWFVLSVPSFVLRWLPYGLIQDKTYFNRSYEVFIVAIPIAILPLQAVIYTLLYYDLRIRHEGYDLELQAQQPTLA